jgi:hypothetical protein
MEADILELGERVEQLNTEIAFRKKNGLDATELQKELMEACADGIAATSTEPDIQPDEENVWALVEKLRPVTPGVLIRQVTDYTCRVRKAWDTGDYTTLDRLLDRTFTSVYLVCSDFLNDDQIGDGDVLDMSACTYSRNPASPEEARQWLAPTYKNLMDSLESVPDAVWTEAYFSGAQAMCDAWNYAAELQAYIHLSGITGTGA